MKIEFTNKMSFGFEGPNLCLLGNEIDFRKFAEVILDLTIPNREYKIEISSLDFMNNVGERKQVFFLSKNNNEALDCSFFFSN